VELIILNLTTNDSSYDYQLEAVNVLGSGLFFFDLEDVPDHNGTETTTGGPHSSTTSTEQPPHSLASKGLIIGISCFVGVVFIFVVGLLVYNNFKKNNETYPMTTIEQNR
jgi:hypothetical protein